MRNRRRARRPPFALLSFAAVALLVAGTATAGDEPPRFTAAQGALERVTEEISNGVLTTLPPSVATVGDNDCTATLIGCRTLLSAAHCFCDDDDTGATCQPSVPDFVFLQHAGSHQVQSVTVHPGYVFGEASDLAVLRLDQPVTGIEPTPLNTVGKPGPGTAGLIVGFGLDSEDSDAIEGLKRAGTVSLTTCSEGISNTTHLCWRFGPPFGAPGDDSNTCPGDSGGPLFVDFGGGLVLAGVTSGGLGTCDGNDLAFDADVFRDRTWIAQQAGADLGQTCGGLPPAGSAEAPILVADGSLSAGNPTDSYMVNVGAGTERLRVTLNGPSSRHDFDLRVDPPGGGPDCNSQSGLSLEECEFTSPTPGSWRIDAVRFDGQGPYQLTTTLFGAASTPPPAEDCTPDATTLCIDRVAGDRRFQLTMSYDSVLGGGVSGDATATPLTSLGIARGGIFAFTNPANPEVLVKVLDGCALTGHFWVFYAATTTLGFELTVEDTVGGASKTYSNPDQNQAPTVTDTMALASCP